jgi:uncharacterized repeat protein (TIGR02543 family)
MSRRLVAAGAVLLLAAVQFVIFPPGKAFAADVSSWSALQTAFSTTMSGTITLTADITGTPGQNLGLPAGADVTLDLNGHSLSVDATSAGGLAGINVPTGRSLTITDTSASGAGHLVARGGLTTLSNGGAGIGGNASQAGGSVTIEAGTVDAFGGYQAAGIGGANFQGGSFTMTGGTLNAVGGVDGAGIGGGWSGGGGTVVITGGTVTATGNSDAAGIGGGNGGAGAAVAIHGGVVTATSGVVGAAVGAGANNGSTGTLDVYASPFGVTGTGGGLASAAPPVTPHTTGVRYEVATAGRQFQLLFGQVLSFDSAGGSSVADQFVPAGSTPAAPTPPTLARHVFDGWFTTSALSTPFDFGAALTADSTAFAKWTLQHHPVSFDLGGHGAPIPDQSVADGDPATEPTPPSATGYTFGGWYTDTSPTDPYDFSTAVTAPVTLHARWTIKQYTVSFDPANGDAATVMTVPFGATVTIPAAPSRTGYTFAGWYTNAAATTKYDVTDPVESDLRLYAGWTAIATATTTPTTPTTTSSISRTARPAATTVFSAPSSAAPTAIPALADTGFAGSAALSVALLLLLGGVIAVLLARQPRRNR